MTPRRTLAAAAGASAILAGVPTAAHADTPRRTLEQRYLKAYRAAERAGAEPGRNIVRRGVREGRSEREATRREIRRSLGVLRRMVPASAGAAASSASPASAGLEAIAACESGGDPAAVDASGTYRGKYQFDMQTWQSVGGTGDPAAASEAEQDYRAQILVSRRGTAPWPNCG